MKIKIMVAIVLASLAGVVCVSQQKKERGGVVLTYQGKPVTKISCVQPFGKNGPNCTLLADGELIIFFPNDK